MKYDVAAVVDHGDKFSVKYVDVYQNSLFKNDEFYVKISNVAGDIIRQAISERKRVYLPKNVEGELSVTDVIVCDTDDLEKDKMIALSNVYRKVDYAQFNVGAIDFYDYLSTFSVLAAAGYFVTDDNREEKYIEIIETGDEGLIGKLEVYLTKKDKLDTLSYIYNKSKTFEKRIMDCEDEGALKCVLKEFDNA